MSSAPYDLSVSAARADALFASPLQRSAEPSARQVRQAIATALAAYGAVHTAVGAHHRCRRGLCSPCRQVD